MILQVHEVNDQFIAWYLESLEQVPFLSTTHGEKNRHEGLLIERSYAQVLSLRIRRAQLRRFQYVIIII
jgi:hypothetical protein